LFYEARAVKVFAFVLDPFAGFGLGVFLALVQYAVYGSAPGT